MDEKLLRGAYLDLLRGCLTRTLFGEATPDRIEGRDWPATAETMIGEHRMNNIWHCAAEVIEQGVPGDFMETGVWRGGAVIFMRAILRAYGITDRAVWCADSFEGVPKPDEITYPPDAGDRHWETPYLAVSLEEVQKNFDRYSLLDGQVRFLKGWFRDTLPTAPVERLAVLRLDGDLYESTALALEHLYPKLSEGGYVIIDDFDLPGAQLATEHYRARKEIKETMRLIDRAGVFWKKGER